MKKIPVPNLTSAKILKPAELNAIHFGGIHTPISPEQIKKLAEGVSAEPEITRNEQKDHP